MKKLTAGIFATILGLTAIDAYAALPEGVSKVATTNYVDGAMGAAVTSAVASAKTYTDTKVGEIVVPDVSGFATKTYVDTQDTATLNSAKTYAESEADAAQAAAATDAATKAGQALTDAKAYTDTKVGDLGTSTDVVSYVGAQGYLKAADVSGKADKTYVDQAELDAVATANAYTDQAELDAVASAKTYTDTAISEIEMPSLSGYATEAWVGQQGYATTGQVATAKTEAIDAAATAAEKYIDESELTAKGYATTGQVATAKTEAIDAAATAAEKYIDESELTAKGYATTTEVTDLHDAQAQKIGVNEVAIKALQDATVNYVTWADVDNSYGD